MFRCVVAVLLLNTFNFSFGLPVERNEAYGFLGKSLQLLSETCQNDFLVFQIKNHLEACNISLSAEREIGEKDLECLIFYDINSRLCTELSKRVKLELNQTYNSIMNQTQYIGKTCAEASKNWKFSNIADYPKYYNASQRVLKNLVKCQKACGVRDIDSEDTNFFCKYYQWGSQLLQPQVLNISLTEDSGDNGTLPVSAKTSLLSSSPSNNEHNERSPSNNEHLHLGNAQEQTQFQHNLTNSTNPPSTEKSARLQVLTNGSQFNNENLNANMNFKNKSQSSGAVGSVLEKSLIDHDLSFNKDEFKDNKEHQNKLGDDNLEYERELSDDGSQTANYDNDQNMDTNTGNEHKPNQNNAKLPLKSPENKDIYPHTMSDQFGEVDDHFFSFFLTATILVIFFYVLYHNKSKFRKVFLGLLVEGRQPGRRRNSRGHEYRRLDTLEQAMSTHSTAPPSKIIY